jgi:transcriptional regulator of acetoin/glycerol metabolism
VAIAPDALEAMALYRWPQNLRELDNLVRQAALTAPDQLAFSQLPPRIQEVLTAARGLKPPRAIPTIADPRADLEHALSIHRGNVRRASTALGFARSHVYRLLKRWNLNPDEFRGGPQSNAHGTSLARPREAPK